jgi:hypothetical protein
MEMKICKDCRQEFCKDEFFKEVTKAGYRVHRNRCKECYKINERESRYLYRKLRYSRDKERLSALIKVNSLKPEVLARKAKREKGYRLKNKEKTQAYALVSRAIRTGELVRGECAYPNGNCSGRIEGHHWDYKNPLEVVWFCSKHHCLITKIQNNCNLITT